MMTNDTLAGCLCERCLLPIRPRDKVAVVVEVSDKDDWLGVVWHLRCIAPHIEAYV